MSVFEICFDNSLVILGTAVNVRRLNRQRVVDQAAALADAEGVAALTMARVAKELGVALPSLYAHVRNLEHLRQEIAIAVNAELSALMAESIRGRAGREAVASLAAAYRAYAVRHAGRYAAATLIRPDLSDPRALQVCRDCARVVCDALLGYGLEGDRLIHAVRFFRAGLHGFASLEGQGGFLLDVEMDASFEAFLTATDRALSDWPEVSA